MKKKIILIITLSITGLFVILGLYFGLILRNQPGQKSVTTIKKLKAAAVTYNNDYTVDDEVTITPQVNNGLTADENESFVPSSVPTVAIDNPLSNQNDQINSTDAITITPTPTEVILALNQISPSTSSQSGAVLTPSVTKTRTLPATGEIISTATIVALAGMLIFFSFLY